MAARAVAARSAGREAPSAGGSAAAEGADGAEGAEGAEGGDPAAPPSEGGASDDVVDPRYEDMWAIPKGKKMVDIPDLAALDVDFEDKPRD